MNFFENELKKIFSGSTLLEDTSYVGRSCYGYLGRDLRVRAEFIAPRTVDHYDTLKVSILNRTNGVVDTASLRLQDVWGTKPVPDNPNFPNGVNPYIWVYREKADWYAYYPTGADYETIRKAVGNYLNVFRPRENEQEKSSLDEKIHSASNKAITAPHLDPLCKSDPEATR